MREDVRKFAKAAVTGLIKPDDLIVAAGHGAIDWLFARLPQKSRLERLIDEVARDLERFVEVEYRGGNVAEAAIGNATTLFELHGPTATDLVAVNLSWTRASSDLLARGAAVLATAGEAVDGLCRKEIVPRVFRKLLSDPALIEEIRPQIYGTLLSRLDEIRKLEGEVGGRHAHRPRPAPPCGGMIAPPERLRPWTIYVVFCSRGKAAGQAVETAIT